MVKLTLGVPHWLLAGDFYFKQRSRCLQHFRPTVLPPCWPCSSVSGTVQSWTALMMSTSFVWDPGEGQMLNLLPVTIHTRLCVCVCVCTFGVGRPPFTFARRNVDISPAAIFSTVFIVSMGVQYFGTFRSCRLSTDKIYLRPLLL